MARRASCSSISPGRPLTPTAPMRVPPRRRATPPRKNVKNGSKLARSAASSRAFSASSRRAGVAARGGVGLALRVQPRIGRGAVHRRRGDELAVVVRHEDGDRAGGLGDDEVDDGARPGRASHPYFDGLASEDDERVRRTRRPAALTCHPRHAVPGAAAEAERPAPASRGVIMSLQVIGQIGFHFQLSIAQILLSLGTCAVLEVAIAFRSQHVHHVAGERDADRQRRRVRPPRAGNASTGTGGACAAGGSSSGPPRSRCSRST